MAGPVKSLSSYLGATGNRAGECVLEDILPQGYEKTIFPYSDLESASRPLVKGRYKPELHLAIGMLRSFSAEESCEDNNVEEHSPPQCDFHREPYIEGASLLDSVDTYGLLFFVIARTLLPKLSPILGDMFCNANTPEEVAKVMKSSFTR